MDLPALQWELTYLDRPELGDLDEDGWAPVTVPGNVQTSPFGLRHPDLYKGLSIDRIQWMDEKYWVYRCSFTAPELPPEQTLVLHCLGVDYRCSIWVNGEQVGEHEGMFTPLELDLDPYQGQSCTVLLLFDRPPQDKEQYREVTKAKFSSGWDFAPVLNTVGLWDEARLEARDRVRITDAWVQTTLANRERALVLVHTEFSQALSGRVWVELGEDFRALPLFEQQSLVLRFEVLSPELWWPNGLGEPTRHRLRVCVTTDAGQQLFHESCVGLREVRRVPAGGQRAEDTPLQFVVNGEPIFINGVNWVPPDACPGEITPEHYQRFLPHFREAKVNLVRVWGGGLCEKQSFYEQCDALGLLVFQEFPVACGLGFSDRPAYLRLLRREAESIVRKLRAHPCVCLFSGGNENYHYWHALDSDEPILTKAAEQIRQSLNQGQEFPRDWLLGARERYHEPLHLLLGSVVAELAPGTLYQNTSALEGEGEVHGIWTWDPAVGDHRYRHYWTFYDYWRQAEQHFYSEASVSAIANLATIRDVCARKKDAVPDARSETWRRHHAFYAAWDKHRDLWLDLPSTNRVFGKFQLLSEFVQANQYLQAEGARFMIEELRRRQPRCAGFIWWGVNEPWPGLAGNALIDYYGRLKPAWGALVKAFQPVLLSLRYEALQPTTLRAELWLSNNDRRPFAGQWQVLAGDDGEYHERWHGRADLEPGKSLALRQLPPIPVTEDAYLRVQVRLWRDGAEAPCYANEYLFGNLRLALFGCE